MIYLIKIKREIIFIKKYEFDAVIKKVEGIDGAYIEIPFDVKKEFGKGRVPVFAKFDGQEYSGQLVKMKTPCHIIGIRKDIRQKTGILSMLKLHRGFDNFCSLSL